VADKYRAAIDAVQPYIAGDEADSTSLAHLNWLSNVDKHRVIHAAILRVTEPTRENFDLRTSAVAGFADVSLALGPLEDGAELLRVSMYSTDPNADMNMQANIPMYVGFGDKGFPARGFRVVFEWVERYILTFEPVFEGKPHLGPPMRRA